MTAADVIQDMLLTLGYSQEPIKQMFETNRSQRGFSLYTEVDGGAIFGVYSKEMYLLVYAHGSKIVIEDKRVKPACMDPVKIDLANPKSFDQLKAVLA